MIVKPGQIYRGLRKSGYVHYIVDSITPSGTEIWMRNITNFKPNRTKHRFCSGLSKDDLIANSLEEYKEKFMPKKHENPVTKAQVDEMLKGSSSFPSNYEMIIEKIDYLTAQLKLLTDKTPTNDVIVMAKIRECLAVPSHFGYSDIGDFLFAYIKGQHTLERFLWLCDVTYLGSDRKPPQD